MQYDRNIEGFVHLMVQITSSFNSKLLSRGVRDIELFYKRNALNGN